MLTPLQAAAVLTLWRSGKWDTWDIARVLQLSEPDTAFVLDLLRDHERAGGTGEILRFPSRQRTPA